MAVDSSIDVSYFEFHALRKVRLTPEPLAGDASKRLAISSLYGIGIAIVATNKLLAFHTADVHAQKADRTNINEEVRNLRTRTTIYFDEKASLVSVSCNCDGTLLGVLADTAAGPMVHIFDAAAFSLDYQGYISPLSCVRVSADAGAAARCFEWSPAAADTLVAAADDRSLVTVAVRAEASSPSTLVGERKLGAAVRSISWSRKGKQLVVGDDLGKVVQMKPELDIVRSTMPPDSCAIAKPAVVGLCWMTTTEFLVVYGSEASKGVQATIMITKKDKPVTWNDLPDINYSSSQSKLPPAFTTLCLLDWNAILTTSTRNSELSVVGKAAEIWQVWVPDELHQASLPTNAANGETFPVGAELDLSASEPLVLSADGQKRAPPSPIVCVLSNDGILMSYHTVLLREGAPSVQVPRRAVNPAAVRVGAKPEGCGGQTEAAVAAVPAAPAPAPPPAPPAAQRSLFGTPSAVPAAAAAAPAAAQQQSLLAQLAATPICSPSVKPPATPPAVGSLFGAAAAATPAAPPPVAVAATPAAPPPAAVAAAAAAADAAKAEKQRKLTEDRGKVNSLLQEAQNEATALVDEMARMKEITIAARPTLQQMEHDQKVDETKKLHGLDGYVLELEEEQKRNERMLKSATIRVADRLRMVEEAGQGMGALATMRKDYDYDREESISQLNRRVTSARTSMAEVQKELQRMRLAPQSPQAYRSDAKWTSDRVERVNGTVKNIQKIVKLEREKVEDVEALVRNVVQLKLSDDEIRQHRKALERDEEGVEEVKVLVVKNQSQNAAQKKLSANEIGQAKRRLINAKSLFPFPAPRRFVPEHQKQPTAAAAGLNESLMSKTLNQSSFSSSSPALRHQTVIVNSPLRAQLEERLLEVTKPRKAILLPALEKFAIKQESRPAQLRDAPSPIVAAAAAAKPPTAAPSSAASLFGTGGAARPAFRLPEPQASSTPARPAAAAAAPAAAATSAASLFGKPTAAQTSSMFGTAAAAAAKDKEPEKSEQSKSEEEQQSKKKDELEQSKKKEDEKAAADAASTAAAAKPAASSIFGGAASSSIFGKPATAAAAPLDVATNGAAAAAPSAADSEKAKEEKKGESEEKKPFSFGGPTTSAADPATAAAANPATSSIFGGGVTSDASKPSPSPSTSSIFGGGATSEGATPATSSTSSIFSGAGLSISAASLAPQTTPTKSAFGAPVAAAAFGAAAASSQPKSIFGGGVAAAPASSTAFGAAAAAAASPSSTSIFGGGVPQQQTSSPFGSSFAKPAATGASSFSFKSAAAAAASDTQLQQQPASGFGQSASVFGQQQTTSPSTSAFGSAFGQATTKPAASGSFAAAAAAAAADEGMDDGGSAQSSTFGGGGGFMGGLGSSTSANAGRNVFGGGFGSSAATTTQGASSIFGKSSTSSFGAKPTFGGGTSSAFGAAASPQQSSSAFSASSPSTATSSFGKPSFGSGPSFGAKSIFGGGAGSPQQQQQQQSAAASNAFGGGFAAFANQGGGFGSVAAQQQQQQGGASSIFGGGVSQATQPSSIFGGGTAAGTTNKFSSWR